MKSESQKSKHTGRKPKFDYKSEEFLSQVETYAKKGFTDREIAFALGLAPQTFCEKKNEHSELCEVLARGRATITAAVRAKFLAMALGGIKTKSTVVRKLKDPDGNLTGEEELQVSESELAPNLQAMSVWLYHMMKNGGRLSAGRTKMQIFQRILTTEFLLTHGLKTS